MKKRTYSAFFLICLFLLTGCEIFAPRKAQTPVTPAPWNTFYIDTSLTLQNLEYAYDYSQNALKYTDILSDEFRFHFAVQDINDYSVPTIWTKNTETDMLSNLQEHMSNQHLHMELTLTPVPDQEDQINAYSAWLYRNYQLDVVQENGMRTNYQGRCSIYMTAENGFWRIHDWYDYRVAGYHSWGKLKYDNAV